MRQYEMLTAVFVALSAFPSAAAFPAVAAESIVGAWSATRACKKIDRIDISSMSLGGEDWYCTFNSVSRKGDVVTWRWRCGSPYVEDDPHPYAATFVARLSGAKLYLSENGKSWGAYMRCKK